MRVLVTGASGHIGSAVVPELVQAGHHVVGLVRSDASATSVEAMGAHPRRGSLDDLADLSSAASASDAVIHLAFDHDALFAGDFPGAVATDLAVVQTLGSTLSGTGKALIGIGMRPTGDAKHDATIAANPRSAVTEALDDFTARDVRTIFVAVPPVTHSARDRHGFIPTLINIARRTGVSGYVDDGANCWPAAHTLDVGTLYRLALEKAPAGSQFHAATEEGIPVRQIAEVIGRQLGLSAVSIPVAKAESHFAGFPFIGIDFTMSNAETREFLGWTPTHPGLIADLEEGHYFRGE